MNKKKNELDIIQKDNKTQNSFESLEILDDIANGIFVDHDAYIDLDMLALRNYMKTNNINRALNEDELNKFKCS